MATETPPKPIPSEPVANFDDWTPADTVVDARLSQTRRQLRSVDLAAGLLWLACATIVWFLFFVILDHWVFTDGLGSFGRWVMLLGYLFGSATFAFFRIIRPLLHRVNPIYLAHRIEQIDTSAKNSLINFLLLRRTKEAVAPVVFDAVKAKAAGDIQKVDPEDAIDWGHVLRIAYLFTALFAIGAIYQVASPKSPFTSIARALFPWSDRAAPTRVTFSDVTPGNLTTFYGERIEVSAKVTGLHDDEIPMLYYSTADNQLVEQQVHMFRPEEGYRYQCTIPPEEQGIQQNITYYLAAGDGRSPTYTIRAQAPPAIAVESVQYDYPSYTRQERKTVTGTPDIVALEGTKITLRTKANRTIERANIDLGCDHLDGIPMTVDDRTATGSWTLQLEEDQAKAAGERSYQILFTDMGGNRNPSPIRHSIRIIPDRIPTVRLINPPDETIELAENGRLELAAAAEDPDFGLRSVMLQAERKGQGLFIPPMLRVPLDEETPPKTYKGTIVFEPQKLNLKAGDEVEYWVEAKDIKTPNANTAQTERRRILIVSEEDQQQGNNDQNDPEQKNPENPEQPENQQPQNQQDQNNGGGEEQGGGENNQAGNEQNNQKNQGEEGNQGENQQNQEGGGEQQAGNNQQQNQGNQEDQGQQNQEGGGENQTGENQQNQNAEGNQEKSGNEQGKGEQNQKSGDQNQTGNNQQQPNEGTQDQNNSQEGQPGDQNQKGNTTDSQQKGAKGDQNGQDQNQKQKNTPDEPINGETNPGDVMEKVLQQCEQNGQDQPKDDSQNSEKNQNQNQPGDQQNQQNGGDQDQTGNNKPNVNESDQPTEDFQKKPQGTGTDAGKQPKPNDQQGTKEPGQESPTPTDNQNQEQNQTGEGQDQNTPNKNGQKTGSDKPDKPTDNGSGTPPDDQQNKEHGESYRPPDDEPTGEGQKPKSPDDLQINQRKEGDPQTGDSEGNKPGEGNKPNQTGDSGQTGNKPGESGNSKQSGQSGNSNQQGNSGNSNKPGESGKFEGNLSEEDLNNAKEPGSMENATEQDLQGKGTPTPSDNQSDNQGPPSTGDPSKNTGDVQPGGTGGSPGESHSDNIEHIGADPFDKDAADRKTALALEYLKDQLAKEKPDPELLESLGGWTRDDLKRFTNRWESMRNAAKNADRKNNEAARRYEEALRSLGLPTGQSALKARDTEQRLENIRQSRHTKPPQNWRDRINAYQRSIGAN